MHPTDRSHLKTWRNLNRLRDAIDRFRGISWRNPQLVDSWILRGHYRATVCLFLLIFVTVTCNWYADDPMQCVNMFDRSQVWDYFQQLCLSYSFTNSSRAAEKESDDRVYAAHYRWIHWTALLIMFIYYLPLLSARACKAPIAQRILAMLSERNQHELSNEQKTPLSYQFVEELGWHSYIYSSYLKCHFFALLVNMIAICIIDTLLQNKFILLVPSLYPFKRDSQHFSDPLSLLFPPFVSCKVGPEMMLLNYRSEVIGCHLTLMELYEKIFIGLWFWQLLLLLATLGKIISLFLLHCSQNIKLKLISVGIEVQHGDALLVVSRYSTGDILLLSYLKEDLDCSIYRKALHHAAYVDWPDYFEEENIPHEEPIIYFD